ncbi:MAG: anti-sigma regulatory factor [Clostridia bacterium]|nr:anti-sigma regulatory factor [Clostridia bacterium]
MEKGIHLEFEVSGGNFASAGTASDEIKKHLKQLGIRSEDVRRVAISMYEGEINMVIHAGGGRALADIYLDRIVIELIDTGKGIEDIELAMQPGYSTAPEDIRALGFGAGMGLPNMKKYTDEFHIESEVGKGTKVVLTVYFAENKKSG